MIRITAAFLIVFAFIAPAQARHHRHHHVARVHIAHHSSGNVVSHKTGATARVGSAYASQFQAYIDDLEANGAVVRFMGGIRPGRCWSGGMHPCGKALDVCQYSRGRVDSRCMLPSRYSIAAIAERHGLFEGGQWCNSDYGHAQVGVSAAACGMFARRCQSLIKLPQLKPGVCPTCHQAIKSLPWGFDP